jgi:tetratricopeptide (TPR) repeat protein
VSSGAHTVGGGGGGKPTGPLVGGGGVTSVEGYAAADAIIAAQIRTLSEEVNTLKRQVSLLQRPWFRDLAVVLALLTFIFSVGTTVFSYVQASEQRLHDTRAELRNLVQRLSALPAEYYDLASRYDASTPEGRVTLGQLNRRYNTELQLLARQAAEVMSRLPAEQISSTEYGAVAVALQLGGLLEQGQQMARQSVLAARDTSDEMYALQAYGQSLFYAGRYGEGREQFRRAIEAIDEDRAMSPDQKRFVKIGTYGLWIDAEISQGQCSEAETRMRDALTEVQQLSIPAWRASQISNLSGYTSQLSACGSVAPGNPVSPQLPLVAATPTP